MKFFKYFIFLILIFSAIFISAQNLQFHTSESEIISSFSSLDPMAVVDMNDDLLDDIVILNKGVSLYIAYQQSNGLGFKIDTLNVSFPRAQWNIAVADMNNDGFRDIICVGNKDIITIVYRFSDSIKVKTVPNSRVYTQSLNIVDINRDQYLDIFITDDENRSRVFMNDKNGEWIYKPNMFNEPNNETISAGNYGSAWADFDLDGDLDLYIAKCKGGVDDPTDPRRQNKLFRQKDDGTFEEIAGSLGLDFGSQSWTSNFGDFDNDGDLDLLVTNHDVKAIVMENDNGQYVNRTDISTLDIEGAVIQSTLVDFDNDGYLDILIGGSPSALYRNMGNWTFEKQEVPSDIYDIVSFGIGDLNNDGFQDIYASFPKLVNEQSPLRNQLFLSIPNDNHFIQFKLLSENSNKDAIGASVQIFYNDQSPIRFIHAGESYGIMHSMIVHFGLGQSEKVDSAIVTWPSGEKILYYPDKVDKTFVLSDFECISIPELISTQNFYNICTGDSVILSVNSGSQHKWNNGVENDSIVVYNSGSFAVSYIDDFGCKKYSKITTVNVDKNDSLDIHFVVGDHVNCYGSRVELFSDSAELSWSVNGESIAVLYLSILDDAEVSCYAFGQCGLHYSDTIQISFLDSIQRPVADYFPLRKNGSTKVFTDQDRVLWYEDEMTGDAFSKKDTITIGPLKNDTTLYVSALSDFRFSKDTFGPKLDIINGGYHLDRLNAGTYFNVYKDVHLYSVKVYTNTPGLRQLNIIDPLGELLFNKSYLMDTGLNEILIDIDLLALEGRFQILTDQSVNIKEFGHNSPALLRTKTPYGYPYFYKDHIRILKTTLGVHNAYYFFDWVVSRALHNCQSDRVRVDIELDTITSLFGTSDGFSIKLFPNPTNDHCSIVLSENCQHLAVKIYGLTGNLVSTQEFFNAFKNSRIDMKVPIQSGSYFMEIWDVQKGRGAIVKLVVI